MNTDDLNRDIQPETALRRKRQQMDVAARADVHEAIRQGLDGVALGRTRKVRGVFRALRKAHGLPR